jgi:hypothetical protein
MIDRQTKALLFAIALGLWLSVIQAWVTPEPVAAQIGGDVGRIMEGRQTGPNDLASIARDMRALAMGTCANPRLC